MILRTHVVVYVRDQRAACRFYRAVLEREPQLDVPGMTEFALAEGVVLGIMPEAGIARLLGDTLGPPAPPGCHRAELYLVVDDPASAHARALEAGARELSPPALRDWGDTVAYSIDPDGIVLAFAARAAPS